MSAQTLIRLMLALIVAAGSASTIAATSVIPGNNLAVPPLAGSALPPGINPSAPAGGVGGGADGVDKKNATVPANPSDKPMPKSKDGKSPATHDNGKKPSHTKKHSRSPAQ